MKKLFLMLICAFVFSATLTSCDKDDNDTNELVGTTWVYDDLSFDGVGLKEILSFVDNNTLKIVSTYGGYGTTAETSIDTYTYTYDENIISILIADGDRSYTETTIYTGGNTLSIWDFTYTKQ